MSTNVLIKLIIFQSEGSVSSKSVEMEEGFLPSKFSKLLDLNHSHFIIVKDAKQRAELEKKMSKINDISNNLMIIHLPWLIRQTSFTVNINVLFDYK